MSAAGRGFDRRAFLKLTGCASVGMALPLVSADIGLASLDGRLMVAQETRMLMGTLVSVTVLDKSAALAQDALSAAFDRMASLTPVFDRHASSGAVYQLNREGRLDNAPPLLIDTIKLCQKVRSMTGGAFDISVAPLIDVTRRSFAATGKAPGRGQLAKALKEMGPIAVSGRNVRLGREGAAVTLDGVAKGFIVDQGLAAVKAKGAGHALINAGGDLAVLGDRGVGRPWRVGIADPQAPTRSRQVVKLTGGAMATSGNYQVYFDREKLYHHIVDPTSGRSPRSDVSASIQAPTAMAADAMSTACFVMKPRQAMAFLNSRPKLEGMILTRHGQRYQTPGFA